MSKQAEVVIIGAGVAGLKAGITLIDLGKVKQEDILILEADSRIGGRLKTDSTSSKLGLTYDLGASWFHDALTNKLLKELESSIDWSEDSKDVYFDDKEPNWYEEKGIIHAKTWKLNKVYEEFHDYIRVYFERTSDDISLKDLVFKYLEEYSIRLTDDQKQYLPRMIRKYELWCGVSWDIISAKYALSHHDGRDLYNSKGYQASVLDKLIPKVEKNVLLNHTVISIDKSEETGLITLETKDNGTFITKNLIVTVPLSVLKSESIKWTPELPKFKETISSIHFGALGKVIFEFDSAWWDTNSDRFDIIPNIKTEPIKEPITSLPPSFSYPTHIINFAMTYRPGNAPSLLCLTQAPLTNYLEQHPEEAWTYFKPMLSQLTDTGKGFTGKEITDPINVITTNWTQTNFKGSYSTSAVNNNPKDFVSYLSGDNPEIATYGKNIRFAGEHTIVEGAGCVHGAYASGERAAKYILENYEDQ